ncbi:Coagulation factor VIII [Exaiptasia diaphana]|nr:Coagulation factor VIII [Exaiptasia diaphana]
MSRNMAWVLWEFILVYGCYIGSFSHQESLPKDKQCHGPLGMQNRDIPDTSLLSGPAYNNDNLNYGAHHARLMSPNGYRADVNALNDSWISVDFKREVVVTGIATQGYGNITAQEWVTQFVLLYSNGGDVLKPFRNLETEYAVGFML